MPALIVCICRTRSSKNCGPSINVSSGVTFMAMPGSATYSSSKDGLNQLSAVARNELQTDGITVSTIYPSSR